MAIGELRHTDLATASLSPDHMPSKDSGGLSGRIYLPLNFPELDLFALLQWRFGSPNGPLTLLGPPGGDPDGPFKWDFLFVPTEPLRLQVIRKTEAIELWWWGASVHPDAIVAYLKYNLDLHRSDIERQIGSLEEYTLILNPFARHKAIAQQSEAEIRKIQPIRPTVPTSVVLTRQGVIEHAEQYGSYLREADQQALFAITLVASSAFMAEAYLNMILALLMRDEIRRSHAIRNETLLRKWKAKLERLPADCRGIAIAPDLGDVRVRDAKRLFDLRNALAHSYPDRVDMKIGTMWFHQRFPILKCAVPFHEFAFALSNQLPSAEDALFCRRAAEAFVEFLRSLLKASVRAIVDRFSRTNPLGFNEAKQIYGIPFGDSVITLVSMTDE